jgi:hypothetical protein
MQEVELTSARLVRVWWAFTWRFVGLWLLLLAVATLASLVASYIMTDAMGLPDRSAVRMAARVLMATMIAGAPVAGLIAVRVALSGGFGGFRLALLKAPADAEGHAAGR